MLIHKLIITSLWSAVFISGAAAEVVKSPGKARLSGTVTDGKVAGQAVVTILAGSTILRQLTGPDGLFSFSELPSGRYTVCVTPVPATFDPRAAQRERASRRLLDSCQWINSESPSVTLGSEENRKDLIVQMQPATWFEVVIDDPQKFLSRTAAAEKDFFVRIAGPDRVVRLLQARRPASGELVFATTVARGRSFQVTLQSDKFAVVAPDTLQPVGRQPVSFAIQEDQSDKVIRFQISGPAVKQ